MHLSFQQSRGLFEKYGAYAKSVCDKCSVILGPVRFTRQGEFGEWCSRLCRGDSPQQRIRKGGRPLKYKTEAARRQAERLQNLKRQKAFRERVRRNGKPSRSITETKHLQVQKPRLSHYPSSAGLAGPPAHQMATALQIVSSPKRSFPQH